MRDRGDNVKIAVISDTHNLLREEVKEKLKESDLILHAGDICSPAVYDALISLAKPMLIVRGNNDGRWAVTKDIPEVADTCFSQIEGLTVVGTETKERNLRIFMVHDRSDIPSDVLKEDKGYDLVVFGHSHKYEVSKMGKTLVLNPGSCGPVRFRIPVTMAMVNVEEGGNISIQKIEFETKKQTQQREVSPGEMKTLVTRVVKDIRRNKSAEYIAKKHKISPELSQQICRLYLTHPGVTVDGILGKMGL